MGAITNRSAVKTVNIQNLSKQLNHEITANPKKAIFLGILMAVGLYFWVPLLWGWVHKDKVGPESSAGVPSSGNCIAGSNEFRE